MNDRPLDPEMLTISREEFARVMGMWTIHIGNLLKPWVDTDPGGARAHLRGCNKAFVTAVCGETRNRFLQEHAVDFAEGLERALIAESIRSHVRGQTNAERKKAQKAVPQSKPRRQILRARPAKDIGD